jgi:hypothetical protein
LAKKARTDDSSKARLEVSLKRPQTAFLVTGLSVISIRIPDKEGELNDSL